MPAKKKTNQQGLRVMTFNVENLLARFRFRKYEKENLATLLDIDSDLDRANLVRTHWNVVNNENRVMTALTIREANPDVICLQEVENMLALTEFRKRYLRRLLKKYGDYEYAYLIEANDRRGIDVAVLSRYRIVSVTSHQEMAWKIKYPGEAKEEPVFRRDCLGVDVKYKGKLLPIFVCHFKSMMGDKARNEAIRRAEAEAVRHIIEERFGPETADSDWLIVGDLNDFTGVKRKLTAKHPLYPLLKDFAVDLVRRRKADEQWTHFYAGGDEYRQIDYMLASPALAHKNAGVKPEIFRQGMPYRAEEYKGTRWPRVGWDRPKASDHCPAMVELKL